MATFAKATNVIVNAYDDDFVLTPALS